MNKPMILGIALLGFLGLAIQGVSKEAKQLKLESPNGEIKIIIGIGEITTYSVSYNNTTIIDPSAISLALESGRVLGQQGKLKSQKRTTVNETVHPLFGKFKTLSNRYNELELHFTDHYSLIFRAFDDGMAYRFVTRLPGRIKVVEEQSDYYFPIDPQVYIPLAKSFTAHYEEHYQHGELSGFTDSILAFTPLILAFPENIKVVLTESDLLDYPGMYLEKKTVKGKPALSGKWPAYPVEIVRSSPSYEVKKRAGYLADTEGSRSFPWRMMIITDKEEDLLTNELVYLLAEPCKLDDPSWIKPGKVAWDWWYAKNLSGVDFISGMNTETYKYYIDFAAENKLEYIIVDGGWSEHADLSKAKEGIDIAYLASYGKSKNVGVIIWVPHNSLTLDLDRYLDLYQSWGVAGLKIDFMERDDQLAVASVADIAEAAAKRNLVIDFHGCSKPAGIHRTYPNILNFEAVLGAEYNKWSDLSHPDHHVMIPFLRMISGPIDYTPGAMRNATKSNFRIVRNEPMSQGTRCHELAMYVVYDAPLVMLSDAPTSYQREPTILDFLSNVETTWDTTVVLNAKIGEYLVVAKRKGDDWHVGALNNWTEREVTIDFSFLPPGKYAARLYTDGVNAGKVASDYKMQEIEINASGKLPIKLASGGGAVLRISDHSDVTQAELPKVEIYQLWELEVKNNNSYLDPLRDVTLKVKLTARDGRVFNHSGFYDGNHTWKIRFSPDEYGHWTYEYWFTDDQKKTSGEFSCIITAKPGRVLKNAFNPFWLAQGRAPKTLFKSFHVGDRFFATNWDDPSNPADGNARTHFLDWVTNNGYNMLSIASCFTNREVPGRGKEWDTPRMWPVDPAEYRKAEAIMDELKERGIAVFPFAGLFGQKGEWPVNWEDQQMYIRYFLARFGHYPNLILNIAGPEPFWAEKGFKNAMLMNDIKRIGSFIDSVDVHNHVITVHNETRASQFGCPFIDEPWCDMATLQGPKTFDSEILFSGLSMNHRPTKTSYANETLWTGNVYHPAYTNDRIRKNTYTILFSGSILNFADNKGESSSGFSGTMDLQEVNQEKHDIVSAVHNWFGTISFNRMTTRQDLVKQGYCLATEGEEYYIYMDTLGKVELYLDYPYVFQSEWINAKMPSDVRKGISVLPPTNLQHTIFETPTDGDDWILHVYAARPTEVAKGNFPDLAVDQQGNIHLVYNRSGLMYRKYDMVKKEWSKETAVGCECVNVVRSDPDVVIDSKGMPHVYCGNEYAWFNGKTWNKVKPKGSRDSELAINSNDQLFLVSRGGNFNGKIGMETRQGNAKWSFLPDPDENGKSINSHVYNDLFVDGNNTLHHVQRHGPVKEVTYRRSTDGGLTWPIEEAISDDRGESPKIVADKTGKVFVSTANGYIHERTVNGAWKYHGRKVNSYAREMPELGIDQEDNLYLTSFGGLVNTCLRGKWMGEKQLVPITSHPTIGFVETAGFRDFAYIVWEEGHGQAGEGLSEDASIIVGILFPDGRIIGL